MKGVSEQDGEVEMRIAGEDKVEKRGNVEVVVVEEDKRVPEMGMHEENLLEGVSALKEGELWKVEASEKHFETVLEEVVWRGCVGALEVKNFPEMEFLE